MAGAKEQQVQPELLALLVQLANKVQKVRAKHL
jgi:hypothetical protein